MVLQRLCLIGGDQSAIGICALFYIYRSAIRCAKFGVAVFKASMLNRWGPICRGYMCIVLYIYRSTLRCAKHGVTVLQASLLKWGGICLPWVFVHCAIYETYLV